MSWYTFFKLKEDSQYKELTIDDCNRKLDNNYSGPFTQDYKSELLATMIQAYYEPDVKKKRSLIVMLVYMLATKPYSDFEYVKSILESDDKRLTINRCPEEWEMRNTVEEWDETLKKTITDLVILASIKFEPDEKYSDTPKNLMDYLRYDYINEINEILELLDEEALDYYRYNFILNECVRIGDEGDYLKEELALSDDKEEIEEA